MQVTQVDAKQGWLWVVRGFALFRSVPLGWIILCTTLLLIAATLSLILSVLLGSNTGGVLSLIALFAVVLWP